MLKDHLVGALNAVLPQSWQVGFREAAGSTIDPDEDQWRPLSGDGRRDLTPVTQQRMQKMAHFLWEGNPLANRIIELPVAFLLAEGVRLTVADNGNQKILDRFWRDPINDMDLKLPKKVRELALFGEQCYPTFVDAVAGTVRLGYIDPSQIDRVVIDPDNIEQPIGVETVKDARGNTRKYRVIINGPESVFTRRTQALRQAYSDGECFLFRINDLSAGRRGRSDLLALADWCDAYEEMLFGEPDRARALRSFFWDVSLTGATPEQVKARSKEITAPRSGSVRVHNSEEVWKTEAPDLNSADTAIGARLIRNHILGGATIPEHWAGGGGDVNRSTGESMAEPTMKMLTMRQRIVKHMLESIGRYVLSVESRARGNSEIDWSDPAFDVKAMMPELTAKDTSKFAQALQQTVVACGIAVEKEFITRSKALEIIASVSAQMGVEIDVAAELDAVLAEIAERHTNDAFTPPDDKGMPGEGDPAKLTESWAQQPRVPAGVPPGGQWTNGGATGGAVGGASGGAHEDHAATLRDSRKTTGGAVAVTDTQVVSMDGNARMALAGTVKSSTDKAHLVRLDVEGPTGTKDIERWIPKSVMHDKGNHEVDVPRWWVKQQQIDLTARHGYHYALVATSQGAASPAFAVKLKYNAERIARFKQMVQVKTWSPGQKHWVVPASEAGNLARFVKGESHGG